MGRRKKDVIEEIEERANEIMDLLMLDKTIQCDPSKSDYVRCVLRKAMVHVELRKRVDKLFYQLGFTFVTTEDIDEKEMIESIVNQFIEMGLINEVRWQKILNDVLRRVNKLSGVDTRERIRRIAEEVDKVFEEGLR
jgi:PII-like signaling protein